MSNFLHQCNLNKYPDKIYSNSILLIIRAATLKISIFRTLFFALFVFLLNPTAAQSKNTINDIIQQDGCKDPIFLANPDCWDSEDVPDISGDDLNIKSIWKLTNAVGNCTSFTNFFAALPGSVGIEAYFVLRTDKLMSE